MRRTVSGSNSSLIAGGTERYLTTDTRLAAPERTTRGARRSPVPEANEPTDVTGRPVRQRRTPNGFHFRR